MTSLYACVCTFASVRLLVCFVCVHVIVFKCMLVLVLAHSKENSSQNLWPQINSVNE